MNFIKDAKELTPKDNHGYSDLKAEEALSKMIQLFCDDRENNFLLEIKNTYTSPYDMMGEYIHRHRKELKEKGYKITKLWFINGYKISWRK